MSRNRIVHFEIPAEHPEVLARFYGELFGWSFQRVPVPGLEFFLCEAGPEGPGIGGAVTQRQNPQQPCMNYVEVESIDESLVKAEDLGASVALPRMPVPGGRAIAVVIDPQGNLFGLMEPPKEDVSASPDPGSAE